MNRLISHAATVILNLVHKCSLISSTFLLGLCQDFQVERHQLLVHQAVSGKDPAVCGLDSILQSWIIGCLPTPFLSLLSFSTLFKFVKKFEEALSGPSLAALVEQGNSLSSDTEATGSGDSPIQRVHQVLKSAMPGQGRDLQVKVQDCLYDFRC